MTQTIGEHLQDALVQDTKCLSNLTKMMNLIRESGLQDVEAYVNIQTYSFTQEDPPHLKISPAHSSGVGIFMESDGPAMRLTDVSPRLSDLAKRLLPFVGKFEKSFDGEQNQVLLTGTYDGIKVILWDDTPKTCRVERIEEEVLVPEQVIPAHTKKQIRYKLVGDCDPILADEASVVRTSQGALDSQGELPEAEIR